MKRFTVVTLCFLTLLLLCVLVPELTPGVLGLPFVAMAIDRVRTRQNARGGGLLKLREIYPTASDTFLDTGYLEGTDLNDEHNMLEFVDEKGELIDALSGSRKAMLNTALMQSGIDEFNLVKNSRGKYYDAYYAVTQENGRVQELSAGIVKLDPNLAGIEFKAETKRKIPLKIYFLSPKAAFTRTPTDYNIVAGVPYVLIENAVAKGEPSDTAATMAAAIL